MARRRELEAARRQSLLARRLAMNGPTYSKQSLCCGCLLPDRRALTRGSRCREFPDVATRARFKSQRMLQAFAGAPAHGRARIKTPVHTSSVRFINVWHGISAPGAFIRTKLKPSSLPAQDADRLRRRHGVRTRLFEHNLFNEDNPKAPLWRSARSSGHTSVTKPRERSARC